MRLACPLAAGLLLLLAAAPATAGEIHSRYATLSYDRVELLLRFNSKVRLDGGFFSFGSSSAHVDDEVRKKLDQFAARVQEILDMRPKGFKFKVVLLPNRRRVDEIYAEQYRLRKGFIAFFSPKTNTIYISVDDVKSRVFAHELAHAVIHHYFNRAPPTKIHELLAQYVESQL
ncbi:hypothetical protein C2E25_02680 [Geothermobacter hydrogeniphilus]|uniref:DUF1570 domain-containing protein n=1 Tax=Geothermobacter hydrogeniphilus TaxID=1969733 RepID=A0A2K2HD95_9BACT|nr:hypothetical protein [Geothermobacter hydrogeniphilus]PNU21223.1 hypothetical protein C2E25_02680 [Geothermobacter hydrogeniphilus]